MKAQYKTFSGGYKFKSFQGQPEARTIVADLPETVIIPLKQGAGSELEPQVKVGDKVKGGQIIGRDDDTVSSPVHASLSGTVEEIRTIDTPHGTTQAVVIASDGEAYWEPLAGHAAQWEELPADKIEELLYLSGAAGLDRGGIPTRFKSAVISPEEVKSIIVHAGESEVYNLAPQALLDKSGIVDLTQGLKILRKVMPGANLHLALPADQRSVFQEVSEGLKDPDWLQFVYLEAKYPQEYDEVLVPTILKKKIPGGYAAANIGVIVVHVQTVLAAAAAVMKGQPVIDGLLALCGPGFNTPLHIRARVGTSVADLTAGKTADDVRIIIDSVLTGPGLEDLSLPIDRTNTCIIALPEGREGEPIAFAMPGFNKDSYSRTFVGVLLGLSKEADTNTRGEKRPCVSCGFCQEVCPAALIPHLLYRFVAGDQVDESLPNLGIFKCIDCNLCSYVCPCKVPLAEKIKDGKAELAEIGCDRSAGLARGISLKGLPETTASSAV